MRNQLRPEVRPLPRPDWSPLPRMGVRNVEGRVLLVMPYLTLAMLRFTGDATIDEHDAPHEVEVVCLEGNGFVSVDGIAAPIAAGESVRWPAGHPHRLWTEDSVMVTLMVEHPAGSAP